MMIDKVKIALKAKKQAANNEELKALYLIEQMLDNEACFLKINIKLGLNMLLFIGYGKEDAKKVYSQLINESRQLLKGKYQIIDDS